VLLRTALCFAICAAVHGQVLPGQLDTQISVDDDHWRLSISPYLWLAGTTGAVGLAGHEAQVSSSFGDILSHIKFGLMGLSEARRKRVGILVDFLFIRVGDQQAVPLAGIPNGVNVEATQNTFTLSPYIAYRLYQNDRVSMDALAGIRYWHLGAAIKLNPDPIGGSPFSGTNNWADGVGGGRLQIKLTPRIGAFFLGDAGAGGADVTWQAVTGLGYKLGKSATLQLGYRRDYVDRYGSSGFIFNMTQQGLILGSTFEIN